MRLYARYFVIQLRSAMQYKLSFFLTAAGQFLSSFSAFLGVYFMFQRFHAVEGFTYSEVLLCFATVLTAFSLAECFFRGFDSFGSIISAGTFDRVLLRPRSPIFQVLAGKMEFTRLGRLLQALFLFAWAVPASGVRWSPDKILTLCLMVLCGTVLFAALFLIYASFCFFTIEGLEFMNIFTNGGREFGSYPMRVYGRGVLTFFTYVIPLACVQYYPLLYLLGRVTSPLYILSPLCGALLWLPALLFWRFGVRRYRSSGS